MNNTNDNVYERIQSTNQALTDRIEQVDHRSSMRVHALEQYTRERFTKEENMCRNRITQKMESGVYTQSGDNMKLQIQDWLEQRLEDYGHCLNHHHDDSALPNENIFTHIQETANGRLFKSRSDETLSQSDNHSGHFKKRDFYESRQAAMQQIRAWQVPKYSRDRNKVRVQQKHSQNSLMHHVSEQHNQRQKWQQQHNSQQNVHNSQQIVHNSQQNVHNSQQNVYTMQQQTQPRTRHLPVEAKVEIRNSANKTPDPHLTNGASAQNIPHTQSSEDSNYMTMSGFETQGAIPKRVSQSQSYQNVRERRGSSSRGPVTHSTPKSRESSPFEYSGTVVRSHTDSGISRHTGEGINARKQIFTENEHDSVSKQSDLRQTPSFKQADSFKQSDINLGSSQNSDKLQSVGRKPTFTTFGYDESAKDGMTAPANSPEQNVNIVNPVYKTHSDVLPVRSNSYSSPQSNSGTNSSESAHNQLNSQSRPYSRQESLASYGFEPSHKDDMHVNSASNQFPPLQQKTRSTEGLLTDSSFSSNSAKARLFSRSQSEDRFLESDISQSHNSSSPRSSSESRGAVNSSVLSGTSAKSSQSSTKPPVPQSVSYSRRASTPAQPAFNQSSTFGRRASTLLDADRNNSGRSWAGNQSNLGNNSNRTDYPYVTMHEIPRGGITNSIHRTVNHSPVNINSDAQYSSVRDVKMQKDNNPNITVKADIHDIDRNVYYSHESLSGQLAGLEPRSPTSYQTYLTGPELHGSRDNLRQRENSPNVCNNSKEDSSSNPDSGYSSKIYGARVGAVLPASNNSTPSSSFSTDRGISTPSNATNSPHSTYSNPDYQQLPPTQQYQDEVQTHVQSWYKRKLQEATERCYDNWKAENSPRKLRQNGGENVSRVNYGNDNYAEIPSTTSYQTRFYGDEDYAKIPTNEPNYHGRSYGNDDYAQISQFNRQNQYGGQSQYNGQPQYMNGFGHHGNGGHLVSTYTRGSDV